MSSMPESRLCWQAAHAAGMGRRPMDGPGIPNRVDIRLLATPVPRTGGREQHMKLHTGGPACAADSTSNLMHDWRGVRAAWLMRWLTTRVLGRAHSDGGRVIVRDTPAREATAKGKALCH